MLEGAVAGTRGISVSRTKNFSSERKQARLAFERKAARATAEAAAAAAATALIVHEAHLLEVEGAVVQALRIVLFHGVLPRLRSNG